MLRTTRSVRCTARAESDSGVIAGGRDAGADVGRRIRVGTRRLPESLDPLQLHGHLYEQIDPLEQRARDTAPVLADHGRRTAAGAPRVPEKPALALLRCLSASCDFGVPELAISQSLTLLARRRLVSTFERLGSTEG